jgi:hypothetical protein
MDTFVALFAQPKEHLLNDISRALSFVQQPRGIAQQSFLVSFQGFRDPGPVDRAHNEGYG